MGKAARANPSGLNERSQSMNHSNQSVSQNQAPSNQPAQTPAMATSHAALLQIAQLIARSDGSVSEQEEQLLLDLPKRLGLQNAETQSGLNLPSLASLASTLTTHGDRCLAARIACLVAGVSRNPGDQQDINPQERSAYRELVAALDLKDEELSEIEWAAMEELKQGKSLLQLIGDALFGEGSWPDPGLMGPEIPGL